MKSTKSIKVSPKQLAKILTDADLAVLGQVYGERGLLEPTVAVGTRVKALCTIEDPLTGAVHALEGSPGEVIAYCPGHYPTVRWASGSVCDGVPEEDFRLLGKRR